MSRWHRDNPEQWEEYGEPWDGAELEAERVDRSFLGRLRAKRDRASGPERHELDRAVREVEMDYDDGPEAA